MDFDDDDDQEEELEDEEDEEMGMPTPVSRTKVVNNNLGTVGVGLTGMGEAIVAGTGLVRKPSGGGIVGGNNGGASSSSMLIALSNIRYRECLKNHAIGVGGHAVDGCGEFMPAGDDGTLDALKCAACSCHRNFHRKEITDSGGAEAASSSLHHHHHHQHPHHHVPHHHQHPFTPQYYRPPGNYIPIVTPHSRPLALPSTSGGGHSRDMDMQDDDVSNPSGGGGGMGGGSSSSKKRFRTKFTQEQKDKMLAFAERLGWRIQKHDEVAVQQFCNELCIKRQVLKVWMHNNKHTLGKKP